MDGPGRKSLERSFTLGAGAILCLWLLVALGIVPLAIRSAYAEQSLPVINRILAGRDSHTVGDYLEAWATWAGRSTVALVLVLIVTLGIVRFRREIRVAFSHTEWWHPISRGTAFLIAGWLGWWTGLLNVGYRMIEDSRGIEPVGVQIEDLWLAPVAGFLAVVFLSGVVTESLRLLRRLPSYRPVVVAGVGVFVYSWLRLFGLGIHPWAAVVLATGVAVQLSSPMVRWREGFTRLVRSTTPWMVAATLLVAVGTPVTESWQERRTMSGLPEPADRTPSVLLLVLDNVRAQSLSLYGSKRPTSPNIDRLARRGVVFDWAHVPAAWSLPSHATMFTGLWPHEHGATWDRRLMDGPPTLAEILSDQGYVTGGFVANMFFAARASGLDRGFGRYRDAPVSWSRLSGALPFLIGPVDRIRSALGNHREVGRKPASQVNAELLEWLDGPVGDRPFFAFLNYFDAHQPYAPPAPFGTLFTAPGDRYWIGNDAQKADQYSLDELDQLEASYDEGIAYVDDQVGALLRELERRDRLSNTIVIVTSDHGEHFGEYGLIGHSGSFHPPVTRVPLIIVDPRTPEIAGRRIATRVTLRDLPASILDLVDSPVGLPGRSLAEVWSGRSSSQPFLMQHDAGYDQLARLGVIDGIWSYVRDFGEGGQEDLYDLSTDSTELNNLAADPVRDDIIEILAHMRHLVDSLYPGHTGRPR